MKERFNKWWSEYFGYTRKERKGMIALAVILFLLVLANAYLDSRVIPPPNIKLVELTLPSEQVASRKPAMQDKSPEHSPVPFDPNTADKVILIRAGFSPKQAQSLMNYRNSGGVFYRNTDLKKLYIMDDDLFDRIEPWIRIHKKSNAEGSSVKFESTPTTAKKEQENDLAGSIDLNSVDSIALVRIKGIGPKTAERVLRYRGWLGGFTDTAQLNEIWGLYPEQKSILLKRCQQPFSPPHKLKINQADQKELEGHPYIRFKAKVILSYRKQHGYFRATPDLLKTGVFSDSLIQKLKPYLEF